MNIAKTHSHFNGLEFLRVRRPGVWALIESAIAAVEADACLIDAGTTASPCIDSARLRDAIAAKLDGPARTASPPERGSDSTNRVAVGLRIAEDGPAAYNPVADFLMRYQRDEIDVGVEILPMKSLQSRMISGVACYEGEFYNVIRNGRSVPSVPLVLVGIDW